MKSAKVAVVTGAAAGIGAAISRQLAKDGINIGLWDRDAEPAEAVAEEVRATGRKAVVCRVDISKPEQVEAAAGKIREELGPITILVNNAGISVIKPFEEITEEEFDEVINVNLKGTFFCTQAVIADMFAAQWGRIVNISSSSAQSGARNMSHYATSKGGVIGFTKALAVELGTRGITVNNVPPSLVNTRGLDLVKDRFPEGKDAYGKSMIPVGRMGEPEDIAAAVSFLASDAASYITGHTLSVNGGRYTS